MQNNTFSIPSSLSTRLLIGTAGIALFAASSASAQQAPQENCRTEFGGTIVCQEQGDIDAFLGNVDVGGAADGAYDNLDSKIEQTAPSETDQADAQADLDAAIAFDETSEANRAAVEAALSDDNRAAFEALETAEQALDEARVAEIDATTAETAADAAFDTAADALTDANVAVTTARTSATAAETAAAAAQVAFDADQSATNLDALNTALTERAAALQILADEEAARDTALAAANDAAAAQTARQMETAAATTARMEAETAFNESAAALDASLATNQDLIDVIIPAGFTPDVASIQQVNDNAETAAANLAATQERFDTLDDVSNTFVRARDVLVPAAENPNEAIAAASQALLGDPRAAETNSEVEVIAALVDHETRITDNTATLVDHETRITDNTAAILDNDARITTNAAAIVTESEARAAGDAELLESLTAETNARIAADTALDTRVDTLTGRVDTIETRLSSFDDRISSSTATAIALGGLAFLPDTKFNLAVSGGFYEGAQAVAANIGYRLNDNTAITAGIGGGLNKNGKVGGRVGVIFGW